MNIQYVGQFPGEAGTFDHRSWITFYNLLEQQKAEKGFESGNDPGLCTW